jgi:hypothetical protein
VERSEYDGVWGMVGIQPVQVAGTSSEARNVVDRSAVLVGAIIVVVLELSLCIVTC